MKKIIRITEQQLKDIIKSKVGDALQSIKKEDPIKRQLEKDGYFPAMGDKIDDNRKLSDPNITSIGNTQQSAHNQLITIMNSKGLTDRSPNKGVILYKKESPNKVIAKWINYN